MSMNPRTATILEQLANAEQAWMTGDQEAVRRFFDGLDPWEVRALVREIREGSGQMVMSEVAGGRSA